ncbi:hypothetical protein FOL47_000482 [Perkinsus chesapeaki]|uniref:Uncharacterized protein n=1 Tax=Perkinsus chesapeaki TaxID=330153 RepID=A0A7J6MLM0_PERCH|nr:hypothetical protein FOL47_000482 [Perkinsus chesapeaki]
MTVAPVAICIQQKGPLKFIKKAVAKGQSHRWNELSLAIYPDKLNERGCYVKSKFYGKKYHIYFKLNDNDTSGDLVYMIDKDRSECPFHMSPIKIEGHVTTGKGDVDDCRTAVRRIYTKLGMKDFSLSPLAYAKRSHRFVKALCEARAGSSSSTDQRVDKSGETEDGVEEEED